MKASPGDKVVVETFDEKIEGVLLESQKKGVLILKLANGYNRGIDEKKVKKMTVVARAEVQKEKRGTISNVKGLPTISLLHTGGTIASKVDYKTGGVIPKFTPGDMIAMLPEIKNIANLHSRFVRQMWSEDMRFAHYNLIAKEIAAEINKGVDGIVVTHGTDTLHYTAAALAFMFEKVPVPVILVGAQRSSDRGSSDAAWNLLSALTFAARSDFGDIAICMHENMNDDKCVILPATKSRKMHSSRRDAFKAVNTTPWAYVSPKTGGIEFLRQDYRRKSTGKVKPTFFKDK